MWADETGLVAGWAGRRLGVPVVVSVLGGELVGLRDIGYGLKRGAFSRWIVRRALSGADRVVVPSGYTRRLVDGAGVPTEKIASITLGVDAARFTPALVSAEPFRLIHVASLVPVKNQALLLRAFALLDHRATLDMVGEGTERSRLQALADDLGIAGRVRFIGAVPHPDLPAHYQRAGLHLLTSRHETICLSVLEAAACGVPTVSTRVGIVPDYPLLGALADPTPETLAAAVQALLDDPGRLAALSRSARATAAGELSITTTADSLRALYGELAR
jgi:glycosyltransferase involved in cell wall biosynthesis